MKGILYIAHGSKMPEKNKLFRAFVEQIMVKRTEPLQQLAFLEKDEESVPVALQRMVDSGLTELTAMPMLLFPAGHATEDIPEQLDSVLDGTSITYTIADCFGDTAPVYRTALKRLDGYDADIFMITAHGNQRFTEPDVRLTHAVEAMKSLTDKRLVPAMLYGRLSFEEQLKQYHNQKIVLMPYFLFDGHLVRKIKRLAEPYTTDNTIEYTETLNLDMQMIDGVLQKLEEVR